MLKSAYISVAQSVLAAPMTKYYAAAAKQPVRSKWQHWFASLGAVYRLDRMIALDIPWWNVAATEAVEKFLSARPNARVFEFGSGASTIWLARRSREITTVEHDDRWANALQASLDPYPNAQLVRSDYDPTSIANDQPYVKTIEGTGLYDLIVIDGRLRNACLANSIRALKKDGIILFDDSGRARYRPAISQCGLDEQQGLSGFPCVGGRLNITPPWL